MNKNKHWAVYVNNTSDKRKLIQSLLKGEQLGGIAKSFKGKGVLFSSLQVNEFLEAEAKHQNKILTAKTDQNLSSMSSGERKKLLLEYLLEQEMDFIILDNPFDNLDTESQAQLRQTFQELGNKTALVQLASRTADFLPFIKDRFALLNNELIPFENTAWCQEDIRKTAFQKEIPKPLEHISFRGEYLVHCEAVCVSYGNKPILKNINWGIRPGEFWQLLGKNGSGKTTLLSLITGDNPKAYGQELYLFGQKKGSGESVWDIKEKIGYFTPSMIDRFRGYHTLEHMLISGLMDSIGLYIQPTDAQIGLAREWLALLGMQDLKNQYFHDLTVGQQRLIMCIRAMIKHPLLLILDEPTAGLDDDSAALFVALVNKIAKESSTAIVFVSHREEQGLKPQLKFQLEMTEEGSVGFVSN